MKKKIFGFVMAICLILPMSFMFVGCNENETDKYYISELKERYFSVENKLESLLYWMESFENNLGMNDRYDVFNYTWWANANGGYSSYTMYMSRNNTYIVYKTGPNAGKPYCKIVGDELYLPNYESGSLKYDKSNYSVEEAISNGFEILRAKNIKDYKERIEDCEYLEYKGYLHNLKTGEYFEVSENRDTNIIFYKTFSDYISSDSFSYWYADGLTNKKHVYLDDNAVYSDFGYIQLSYSSIEQTELPLGILEAIN